MLNDLAPFSLWNAEIPPDLDPSIHRDFPRVWQSPRIPRAHLAAGILLPENEGAPEAPLERGNHGELQCLELQLQ